MNKWVFNGDVYNDDRLFVLYLCKCTVDVRGDLITTTVYHQGAPEDYVWCLVTYRNLLRYNPVKVDHFHSENDARAYMKIVEPQVPLISLGGRPLNPPLTYEQFLSWKERNSFKEYDYKEMYPDGAASPSEIIVTKR